MHCAAEPKASLQAALELQAAEHKPSMTPSLAQVVPCLQSNVLSHTPPSVFASFERTASR